MAILVFECTTAKERRPEWLRQIVAVLRNVQRKSYIGSREDMEEIQYSLNAFIRQLKLSGTLNVDVTTEITSGNVLLIKKPRVTVITAEFK